MPCWYYEKEALSKTPSIKSGLTLQQERTFRKEGASYILDLGNYLKLTATTCATACTYFHRFYMFQSFNDYPRFLMATACLFLAGKVEETPKKWKVVWKAAGEILKQDQMTGFEDGKLLLYERILLQTIQFDLIVEHPYQYILKYVKNLKGEKSKVQNLVQMAWTFANDGLRTTLSLEWEPSIIAIAFLCLAGKFNEVNINEMQGKKSGNWWDNLFDDLSNELIEDICHQVLDLYSDSESENKLKRDVKKKPSKVSPNSAKSSPRTPHSEAGGDSSSAPPESKKSKKSSRPSSRLSSPHVSSSKSGAVSQQQQVQQSVSNLTTIPAGAQMTNMPPGTQMILTGATHPQGANIPGAPAGQQAVIIHAAPTAMYAYQPVPLSSTNGSTTGVCVPQTQTYTHMAYAAAPTQTSHTGAYLQPVTAGAGTPVAGSTNSGATIIYPQTYITGAHNPNGTAQIYTAAPGAPPPFSGTPHRSTTGGNHSTGHSTPTGGQHTNYTPTHDVNSHRTHAGQAYHSSIQQQQQHPGGLQHHNSFSHQHQQSHQHSGGGGGHSYQNTTPGGVVNNNNNSTANHHMYYQPAAHLQNHHQNSALQPPTLQPAPGVSGQQAHHQPPPLHSAFHQTAAGTAPQNGRSNWQTAAAAAGSTGWMK